MPVKDSVVPASSRRDVDADPGQHATHTTRLQTLACSGGTPAPSNAEYDTSEVTPPAAPTAPATINATAYGHRSECGKAGWGACLAP